MATIKKAQGGGLVKKAIKAASNAAPKVEKELSVFQKMRLAKGKPLTHFNMDEQKASGALNKAINSRTNPEAAVKKMTKAQRQAKEIDDSYRKNGGPVKKAKTGGKFPDLNKDGKVTRADILKGRGVIAQNGKKMQGVKGMSENDKLKKGITKLTPVKKAKTGTSVKKCKYGCK